MTTFLLNLFRPRSKWLNKRVHAWHYTQWGRAVVRGVVMAESEDGYSLTIERHDKSTVTVWKHDTRARHEPLPVDLSPNDP